MNKRAVIAILGLAAAIIASSAYYKAKTLVKPTKAGFIALLKPLADRIKSLFGIDPVITISQAALESGWGASGLTLQANNYFGMKVSKDWAAKNLPTWSGGTFEFVNALVNQTKIRIVDAFKKYNSIDESVNDWASLISGVYKTAYRYAKAGDVAAYGQAIHDFGYSTDPNYSAELMKTADEVRMLMQA